MFDNKISPHKIYKHGIYGLVELHCIKKDHYKQTYKLWLRKIGSGRKFNLSYKLVEFIIDGLS